MEPSKISDSFSVWGKTSTVVPGYYYKSIWDDDHLIFNHII